MPPRYADSATPHAARPVAPASRCSVEGVLEDRDEGAEKGGSGGTKDALGDSGARGLKAPHGGLNFRRNVAFRGVLFAKQ